MNTRERIEAEIARLGVEAESARMTADQYDNMFKRNEWLTQARLHLQNAVFLRAMLADLPAESPPTLADDLRALAASMDAPPHDNTTAFYADRLREILRKHGEGA